MKDQANWNRLNIFQEYKIQLSEKIVKLYRDKTQEHFRNIK